MKVLCVKSGKFSFDPVNGPVFDCVDGALVDLPDYQAKQLLDSNWAESLASIREKEKPPWQRKNWDMNSDDAKQQLIEYAFELFGVNFDRRKSVKNIIKEIKKLIGQYD